MTVLHLAARRCALAVLLTPLVCAADGLLRGSMPGGRPGPDPAGVQVMQLPSGAQMKRLPGQPLAGDPATASAAPEAGLPAGVSVQQSGAAQMQVMAGSQAVVSTARPTGLASRQSGGAVLLELPGQRSPTAALSGVAAATTVPAGVRIVDLSATEPLPLNPQPNTLYRRLP